ncbi:unnamed protein product [Cuscuta campestris]|uniref:Uncharacterized protein n=1 Tax=Cuscuta campestris TaxID=132261 RepID=A0A484NCL8_9ASTE|nr:unnamed protein product [Cuscuta campestris]
MDLCKEMATETTTAPSNPKDTVEGLKPSAMHQNIKTAEKPPPPTTTNNKPSEDKAAPGNLPQWGSDAIAKGTYRVGGSAFGWNFIYYPGGTSVYYGRTKESFRSANPKSQ